MQPLLRLFLAAGPLFLLLASCTPSRPPAGQASAPAGRAYRSGELVKMEVLERQEGGPAGPVTPPTAEGEAPPAENPEGRLVTFTIESGGATYVARCVEGVAGCRAADLAAGPVRFRIEGGTLYLERPGGELAARVVEAQR